MTNTRDDKYGGSTLVQRGRFAADILKAVRAEVGPDYPVIIRLSQWKQQDFEVQMAKTPQEMEAWLAPLADAGADMFHCSQRRFWEPEYEGSDLNFAGWAKNSQANPRSRWVRWDSLENLLPPIVANLRNLLHWMN